VENLIKLHKTQLASYPPVVARRWPIRSCSFCTAAYWLMLATRAIILKVHPMARAEFASHPAPPLKIVARVSETTTRARIALAAACTDAALFRRLANTLSC